MKENGGYDILELKEDILERGRDLESEALTVLKDARKYRPRPIEAFRRTHLANLDDRYDTLYRSFLDYEGYVEGYMGMAARPITHETVGGEQTRRISFESHFPLLVYALHISSQRETLRAVLRDVSDAIGSGWAQANSNAALLVAALALTASIVALVL